MNKYLEKLAQLSDKEKNHLLLGTKIMGGVGGVLGGGLTLAKAISSGKRGMTALRSGAYGLGAGALAGGLLGAGLAHFGNKQNHGLDEKLNSVRNHNDEINDDMIDYVYHHHPEYDSSREKYGQTEWGLVTHKNKAIGVNIYDPKLDDNLRVIGKHFDKVIIHPKYQSEFKHLHLKDRDQIPKDKDLDFDWS